MPRERLPLHVWHESKGADFLDEDGLMIPYTYGYIRDEYDAARRGAALVDLCWQTRYRFEGESSVDFLNNLLTVNVEDMRPGQTRRCYMCNERGGIIDVLHVYRDAKYWLASGNLLVYRQATEWINRQVAEGRHRDVRFVDVTSSQGHLAVLGKGSETIIQNAAYGSTALDMAKGESEVISMGSARALLIRRDYGLIEGYDLMAGSVYIQPIWERLYSAIRPAGGTLVGRAALEILRVEMGQARIGVEIDEETTPHDINEITKVDFRKRQFMGRRALLHSTSSEFGRSLVCLRLEGEPLVLPGAEVFFDQTPIGRVTSVADSPTIRSKIALGFVSSLKSFLGNRLNVETQDGKLCNAEVVRPPISPDRT